MTTVQSASSVDQALLDAVNPKKKTDATTAAEAQDRFLTLLTTQLKNQDPLNPLDNSQVTSQLAQLSTVTGIEKLNATVASLFSQIQSSQSLQSSSLIGHGVIAPGSSIKLTDGNAIYGVNLPAAADKVQVSIKDANGLLVRKIDLGVQPQGVGTFTWDGKNDTGVAAQNGTYNFSIEATKGGDKVDGTTLSFGLVDSVTSGEQGNKLKVSTIGDVNAADVVQIF
jgi:flagellar basal-body rod modification protein FlgD